MKHPERLADVQTLSIQLTTEQWDMLNTYEGWLRRLALPRGMVAPGDADRLWERHVIDSLRGAVELGDSRVVADLGSGAGLPGIPLAIAAPDRALTLVEPRRHRVAFLEAVVSDLRLENCVVFAGPVERVEAKFETVTARAFGSVVDTWSAAARVLMTAGVAIYWAGRGFDARASAIEGVEMRVSTRTSLADAGPLVIMTRQ